MTVHASPADNAHCGLTATPSAMGTYAVTTHWDQRHAMRRGLSDRDEALDAVGLPE